MQNRFEPLSAQPTPHLPVPLLEEYLDRFCAPLADQTTDEQRLAIRAEIRAHILGLSAAHEELGCAPEEALQAAIRQFGEADQIGRSLSREYPSSLIAMGPLLWALLHGVIGGGIGALVFLASESMFQQLHLISSINISVDCLAGLAVGWIPGLYLWKRPVSPVRAALRTGAFYSVLTTSLAGIAIALAGPHTFTNSELALLCIAIVGVNGAFGGAAMSALFRLLKRFKPGASPKSLIAR